MVKFLFDAVEEYFKMVVGSLRWIPIGEIIGLLVKFRTKVRDCFRP